MLDEIVNLEGAIDLPDERDFIADHILGEPEMEIPRKVDLKVIVPHDQDRTMHCTSYGLTHCVEIMNTLEHKQTAKADPEEQWANQCSMRGEPTIMEKTGDSLQNALKSYAKWGLSNKSKEINLDKFVMEGWARVERDVVNFKKRLTQGYPIYTGWSKHCFCIVGFNDDTMKFTALNSYGEDAGPHKNGTFDVGYEEINKLFSPYILFDKKDLNMIFQDVSDQSPMAAEIKFCLEKGLMKGYGTSEDPKERSFMPEKPITRAEMAAVITRLFQQLKS